MNKKKLTLLIALSIIIIITVTTFIIEAVKPETKVETITTVKNIDPLPPSAVEESIVEEEVIKEEPQVELLSIEEIAKQVINGSWGSGEERKTKLIEAGYNYDEVQAKVAELMPKLQSTIEPAAATSIKLPTGEYPEAQLIWDTMISWGWTAETCAGIIGNMMRECGGDTLNLHPYANNGSHYGLCQWSRKWHSGAWGKDINGQLEYLKNSLNLSIFSNCTTPEETAQVFHDRYERSGDTLKLKQKRQTNARIVYEYFMNK